MSPSRVALITASSAGLGAATAFAFAAAGYQVVINYHSSEDKANNVLEAIRKLHQEQNGTTQAGQCGRPPPPTERAMAIRADMSRRQDIGRLVETAVTAMGRLDVVVSNQGWTQMRRFDDLDDNLDEDDWDMCFNMNVKSHLYLFHAVRNHLQETKGCFITVASVAGVVPSGSSIVGPPHLRTLCLPLLPVYRLTGIADNGVLKPYSVTKAAQLHLVKTLAKVARPQIRVNSVSPGILMTVGYIFASTWPS
jgi:NAD(P)-dependent dehydrogenase (short-subunit alcohol dehydrogenase family)